MSSEPKAYFTGIEKKLIENIKASKSSIKIAVAWFTNDNLKDCLIEKKRNNPQINIEIVVDDNKINSSFFLNYKSKFDEVNILIREKIDKIFLHHKFMVIDEQTTITGSYNYSKKAESNSENIVVIDSENFSSKYVRVFKFLTTKDYIDESIKLLMEKPAFAQEIISTYYNFTKAEYLKYRDKIQLGDCFTHDNGMNDEIKYFPGLIFNSKVKYEKNIEPPEFKLPVDKEIIKLWVESRNMNLILDYYNGKEAEYHLINEVLEKNEKSVEKYFKRKMEHTYRYEKLKELIENGIDIILEDDFWVNNFEPFLNKQLIGKIFDNIVV